MRRGEKLVAALKALRVNGNPITVNPVVITEGDVADDAAAFAQIPAVRSGNFKGTTAASELFRVQIRSKSYGRALKLYQDFTQLALAQPLPFVLTAPQDFYNEDTEVYIREVTVRVA